MTRGRRRAYDEEPRAERRLSSAHEHQSAPGGPTGEVLRLQILAGNAAVNAMMRSPAIQRDEGGGRAAPADTKEKPKGSGVKITVEGLGEFEPLSYSLEGANPRVTGPGTGGGKAAEKEGMRLILTKETDDLTPLIYKAAALATTFPTGTFGHGGMRLVMKKVSIESIRTSDSGGRMLEHVRVDAEEAKWEAQK